MQRKIMQRLVTIFTLVSVLSSQSIDLGTKPKIGLVLSGGGAYGFAHIGTLKMIDSLDIPIDYIAGTSMGGIVGALYAIGYDGKEIEHLARTTKWNEVFSDAPTRKVQPYFAKKDDGKYQAVFTIAKNKILPPSGLIKGQKISLLLSALTFSYEKMFDFDLLPTPYRCTAVDLLTGNEVVLKQGSLAKAMRSTMSIPTVFNPVAWGDSLLIDGGLLNNLPVDVVKDMGADIVIAVNVGRKLKNRNELQSILAILEQTVTIPATIKKEKNLQEVDIFIEPMLDDFSPVDFFGKKRDGILYQGDLAAQTAKLDLIKLKERHFPDTEDSYYRSLDYPIKIHGINISGNTTLPFQSVYEIINIKPGDYFEIDTLKARIRNARHTGLFELIDYDIQPINESRIKLNLRVKEKEKPKIHRISIRGNELYSFSFLYQKLGLSPGQKFSPELLENRIGELYSLGYFETINYEITPLDNGKIHLTVVVDESPQNNLSVGLHYDETNKFVGSLKVVKTNALLKGLRFEGTLQLAGLTKLSGILYYPSNANKFSLYPYLRSTYRDLPINIFDQMGNKIAAYHDRSTSAALGVGFAAGKNWDTKIEFNTEFMDINPSIALRDSSFFPTWKDELHTFRIYSNIDKLDNVLNPKDGFKFQTHYEQSFTQLRSDLDYTRISVSLDYYKTFSDKYTLRFLAQYGYGDSSLPVYKWHYISGPQLFVGLEPAELGYYRTSLFRTDYQYRISNNLSVSAIYNFSPNYNGDFYPIERRTISGMGLGLKYSTAFGPIELIIARGDRLMPNKDKTYKNVYYLSMGYKI
ncbi:patatin-like phospholipase family protein [Candidatus Neomarinimicrobiota bacterium]